MNPKTTPKRPRLSVAMIVRDEQDVICRTLENIHKIADEIVILDTGSQDETASIARRWGAKVRPYEWSNSFADARNTCMEWATGDWVLWLDAGEQISVKSAQKLRDFVNGNPDSKNVYLMMVETPPADPLASAEQVAQIRLIPRAAKLHFEGRIRENLLHAVKAAGMEIETAPGRIMRDPRVHLTTRKLARARRNLQLTQLERRESPYEDIRLLLAEGEAYSDLDMNEQARDAYVRAIEISEPGSSAMLEGYYGLLSCYNNNPQLRDCQLETGLKALETFPFDVQLLLVMGSFLQTKDRLDLATRAFEIAVQFGQIDLTVPHLREVTEVATSCLCMILQLQGRTSDACNVLHESLGRYPQSARLLRHGLELYIKMDKPEKAIQFAEKLAPPAENLRQLADVVYGACCAATSDWLAALGYLQGAYVTGCRSPLCLRWLTVTLLGGGAIEEARSILDEWRQVEPNHPEMLAYRDAIAGLSTTDGSMVSQESTQQDSPGRQYRFDSGVATTEIAPLGLPNLPQVNTLNTMFSAESR
jgi:tetratricopeptide (TPR) repeat protein